MNILITGGAGFIGSNLCHYLIKNTDHNVINFDKLTYAGNLESLKLLVNNHRYTFVEGDICDAELVRNTLSKYSINYIMHLAAESHVDRSIDGPKDFINTNIIGTYNLLECARNYYNFLPKELKETFRFLHVSTDEVYGSLGKEGLFVEHTAYAPNSPYSASKASADHLVRAWYHTFGLPVVISNCSNNYGPYQFPEKLIPVMILNALEGKTLPVYGDGKQIRDWLYVEDHCKALYLILTRGRLGEKYNVGGNAEKENIDIVNTICSLLDEFIPNSPQAPHNKLITYVVDRPGHDKRYAIDFSKLNSELGWKPEESFATGIRKTVKWYLDNQEWWQNIRSGVYRGERIGLGK